MKKKKVTMHDVLSAPNRKESEKLLKQHLKQDMSFNFFNFLGGRNNEIEVENVQVGKPPDY